MACSYPLNASPWLIAENQNSSRKSGPWSHSYKQQAPNLVCLVLGPLRLFSIALLYFYILTYISLSFCLCVSLYLCTHTQSQSLPLPHIPSSPFIFAVFHFLFLHFLFLQETLTFRMKKHQWPQSYHFIVITRSWCWCFSSFYYVFIPIILTSDNKTQVTLKAN